jgi:hypothetical protein
VARDIARRINVLVWLLDVLRLVDPEASGCLEGRYLPD